MPNFLFILFLLSIPFNLTNSEEPHFSSLRTKHELQESVQSLPSSKIGDTNFLKDTYQWITNLSEKIRNREEIRESSLEGLIPFFIILVFGFGIAILFMVLSFFLIKIRRYKKDRKHLYIEHQYQNLLVNYYVNQTKYNLPRFPGLKLDSRKETLFYQLYKLGKNFYGKKQQKLQYLYENKNLHPFIIKKIRRSSWSVKALYLEYLSMLPFAKGKIKNISKLTKSKNPQVRLYSQLTYMTQYPELSFSFLDKYPYILTDWDQLNLYDTMLNNSLPVPDLYPYLQSENPSVIIFCLRLIRWYYLKKGKEEELLQLIYHSNPQIRLETYTTLTELHVKRLEEIFLFYYQNESKEIKKTMIDYFRKNKKFNQQLLHDFIEIENSQELLMYLLESYYNQSFNSRKHIMQLREKSADAAIRSMCASIIKNTF